MKNAKWMLPLTLMLLSGLMAAQSFMTSRVVAQVPFEYVVNNKIMPAGESLVKASGMDSRILAISNFDARQSGLVGYTCTESKDASEKTVLVFKRYGDLYFLSSIRVAGSNLTYTLPQNKAEVELRSQNVISSQTVLLADLR
jgi:hypothetical protein